MSTKFTFEDGCQIEWIDRENYKYLENGYSVLIWVDTEPGFFNSGRVIKATSITKWDVAPAELGFDISTEEKLKIIDKLSQYFDLKNQKYRIEN
jgi:hypothetical protein